MAEPDASLATAGRDLEQRFGERGGRLVRVHQAAGSFGYIKRLAPAMSVSALVTASVTAECA